MLNVYDNLHFITYSNYYFNNESTANIASFSPRVTFLARVFLFLFVFIIYGFIVLV